jgi:hypothetical protein
MLSFLLHLHSMITFLSIFGICNACALSCGLHTKETSTI